MRLLIFGIIIVIGSAVITYSANNNNVAYGQLEKYKSYDPITDQFNMTKYLSEEASPEIRAAYQKLMIAFYNAIMYEYGTLLKYNLSDAQIQEYVNSQTPKLVDLGMEYYGLIAKQDPEVAALKLISICIVVM